jgi:hypothetical protein
MFTCTYMYIISAAPAATPVMKRWVSAMTKILIQYQCTVTDSAIHPIFCLQPGGARSHPMFRFWLRIILCVRINQYEYAGKVPGWHFISSYSRTGQYIVYLHSYIHIWVVGWQRKLQEREIESVYEQATHPTKFKAPAPHEDCTRLDGRFHQCQI